MNKLKKKKEIFVSFCTFIESPKKNHRELKIKVKRIVKENLPSQIVLQEHVVLVNSDRQQHFCRDERKGNREEEKRFFNQWQRVTAAL